MFYLFTPRADKNVLKDKTSHLSFLLCYDIFVYDKNEKSDDDSTTYWLCYRDTEHEWKRSVSAKKYHSVEAGTTITSVYIGNATQPEIVYDIDGTVKV